MARIGVLALQGNFAKHAAAFEELGERVVEVRHTAPLEKLDGLVIPGGESTTLLNLMRDEPWFEALRDYHSRGGALFGTCAGAILLSRRVRNPEQPSLGLLDAVIRRNAFGRQVDSFETKIALDASQQRLTAVFIRAPRFVELGQGVEVLARLGDEPVLVRQNLVLAATFHPELTRDRQLQRMFIDMASERVASGNDDSRHPAADSIPPGLAAERQRRITC